LSAGIIDEQLPVIPLKRISPSRYEQLQLCALREIWTAAQSPNLLPRNPVAILGSVAHQLLEEAGRSGAGGTLDPVRRWEQLVEKENQELRNSWFEANLSPLSASARTYEVLKIRACKRASDILTTLRTRGRGISAALGTGFELWVESRDKAVGGWIDSARRGKDGIVLSDFKSGALLEKPGGMQKKEIKESHSKQLKLYAALYLHTYGTWPKIIQIVPLSGRALEIPFTHDECIQLLRDASDRLKVINARISAHGVASSETLANASPESCRFCSYRPACKVYRNARKDGARAGGWPTDSFGQVWDLNTLKDGRVNLRLSGDDGVEHTLRALDSDSKRNPALKEIRRGDYVGIFNARISANASEFSEVQNTVLYKFAGSASFKQMSQTPHR
jgi:hypothetical protein